MGRPRKTVKTTTIETEREEPEAQAAAVEEPEKDVDIIRALTELDGADTVTWQVHRLNNPNPGFCGTLSTVELTLERIAADFGTGRYTVKGIKSDGTYYKSARITIAQSNRPPPPDLSALAKGGDMMPLVLAMMNQNTQVLTAALARPERPEGKGFPTEALLTAMPALLVAAKELFRTGPSKDPTEQLLSAVELVDKLKGDATGATWVDLIKEAIPTVGGAVKDVLAARTAPAAVPAVPAIAAPPAADTSASAVPAVLTSGEKFLDPAWQRQQLGYLIGKAQLQREVGLYVDYLLDEIPGYVSPALVIQQLERADWWEILVTFEPAVAPHQAWFDTLRRGLLSAMLEDNGEGTGT